MAKNYEQLAQFIMDHVGGQENVISLTHCITRLRFKLKDESKADTQALKARADILGVIQKGGQYQVVIGNDVAQAYEAVVKVGGIAGERPVQDLGESKEKKSLFDSFASTISSIFTPLLGLLCGCGVIKGLVAFFAALGWLSTTSGTYIILYNIGDVMFYFFPIFVGYTVAERFGMNKFVGMAVGAALIHPQIAALASAESMFTLFQGTLFESEVKTTLLGIPVMMMNYSSTVIPALLACWVGSKVEKFFKMIIPTVLNMFLVPAGTLVVTVGLTLIAVGPLATWISDIIGAVFVAVHGFSPVLTGVLVGGLWQILVMSGIHQGLVPIKISNMMTLGYDNVICLMQAVPFVTCAVVLAIYLKSKDKRTKDIALPAAISSFFGVSEPSIYGVTLPLKWPFLVTLVCSAVGGGIMGAFGSAQYTQGGLGLFAFPAYINPETGMDISFYGALVGVGVAMLLAFVITLVVYQDKKDGGVTDVEGAKANKAAFKKSIGK